MWVWFVCLVCLSGLNWVFVEVWWVSFLFLVLLVDTGCFDWIWWFSCFGLVCLLGLCLCLLVFVCWGLVRLFSLLGVLAFLWACLLLCVLFDLILCFVLLL